MVQILVFLILTGLSIVTLLVACVLAVYRVIAQKRRRAKPEQRARLEKMAWLFAVLLLLNTGLILLSQFTAATPPITDKNGNTPEQSIAELREVELNGRKQWISIRAWDKKKPVLLFLAGGPGGTQMAAVRHELAELERHFVVVNWDQPGSGKSYYAEKTKNISTETYIEDGYALTEYLKERFSQEKIFLIGESWGSALGIFLVEKYPESYHGLIGAAQMVDFAETERMDYAKAMELAQAKGEEALIQRLSKNGAPPYYGKDVTWKSAVYLNYLSAEMARNPEIYNPGYNTLRDIGSTEYGLLDKINFFRGLVKTYNQVYQQLYTIDMRKDYTQLEVPVYFFLGRHDLNAPVVLAKEYAQLLDAPDKKIVWFEHSGHSPWINEREKFMKEVLVCFLGSEPQA